MPPRRLTDDDREEVIRFVISRLGTQYDMRNIIDFARYLLPTPPVPTRWRRRMIALGSVEPTRTIRSTLIAEAFGRVEYPTLPRIESIAVEARGISQLGSASPCMIGTPPSMVTQRVEGTRDLLPMPI